MLTIGRFSGINSIIGGLTCSRLSFELFFIRAEIRVVVGCPNRGIIRLSENPGLTYGLYMGYIWVIYGLHMAYIWVIYGLHMGYIWVIYGLYMLTSSVRENREISNQTALWKNGNEKNTETGWKIANNWGISPLSSSHIGIQKIVGTLCATRQLELPNYNQRP